MRIWIVTLVAITLGLWAVTESSDAQSTRQSQGNGSPSTVVPPGKIQIHLFGGDVSPAAPLAKWYRELGITDVWLYPLKGAFPQDQKPEDQQSIENLKKNNVLVSYRQSSINYWWFERPVPDVMYYQDESRADVDKDVIWGDSTFINGQWATMCDRIATVYANVCEEGFSGIVYDNEAYYSYVGKGKPWLWEGHPGELGPNGNYYKRGLQIGKAIGSVWPRAKVMMVYAMGYPGEYWWYKGFQDAGVDLYLAIEHTYGAGPEKLGDQWYQHWWRAGQLTGVVDEKRTLFDFIPDDRHIVSGVFPIDFGAGKQNYDVRYFAEQLRQVSTLRGAGPFGVWIWPQGSFTPDSWKVVRYPQGTTFDSYWGVMRSYSLQDQ